MRFVFRRPSAHDTENLRSFAARIYYETFISVNTPENMRAYLESAFDPKGFAAELVNPRATFILAEVEDELAGYAKLCEETAPECVTGASPIELVRFYIDRKWHGSGLASALMEECLSEARHRGFKTMYLGVWEKNERAKAFYRKWNFRRVGEHVFYMGDDPQIDWWLARDL